jgi:hypothetical protein
VFLSTGIIAQIGTVCTLAGLEKERENKLFPIDLQSSRPGLFQTPFFALGSPPRRPV